MRARVYNVFTQLQASGRGLFNEEKRTYAYFFANLQLLNLTLLYFFGIPSWPLALTWVAAVGATYLLPLPVKTGVNQLLKSLLWIIPLHGLRQIPASYRFVKEFYPAFRIAFSSEYRIFSLFKALILYFHLNLTVLLANDFYKENRSLKVISQLPADAIDRILNFGMPILKNGSFETASFSQGIQIFGNNKKDLSEVFIKWINDIKNMNADASTKAPLYFKEAISIHNERKHQQLQAQMEAEAAEQLRQQQAAEALRQKQEAKEAFRKDLDECIEEIMQTPRIAFCSEKCSLKILMLIKELDQYPELKKHYFEKGKLVVAILLTGKEDAVANFLESFPLNECFEILDKLAYHEEVDPLYVCARYAILGKFMKQFTCSFASDFGRFKVYPTLMAVAMVFNNADALAALNASQKKYQHQPKPDPVHNFNVFEEDFLRGFFFNFGQNTSWLEEEEEDRVQESCDILKIKVGSTQGDAKKAFHTLAMQCHPDKNPNNPVAEENFKKINNAYNYLKEHPHKWDQAKRKTTQTQFQTKNYRM